MPGRNVDSANPGRVLPVRVGKSGTVRRFVNVIHTAHKVVSAVESLQDDGSARAETGDAP